MPNDTVKCPHCSKIFFSFDSEILICPFCNKTLNALPDIFGEIFGNQNNPFSDPNQGDNDGLY